MDHFTVPNPQKQEKPLLLSIIYKKKKKKKKKKKRMGGYKSLGGVHPPLPLLLYISASPAAAAALSGVYSLCAAFSFEPFSAAPPPPSPGAAQPLDHGFYNFRPGPPEKLERVKSDARKLLHVRAHLTPPPNPPVPHSAPSPPTSPNFSIPAKKAVSRICPSEINTGAHKLSIKTLCGGAGTMTAIQNRSDGGGRGGQRQKEREGRIPPEPLWIRER
ncbi:unnamed protein product [Pleuronectes platessa]|uniref:Uncharacterized protein n=1 Tax=Pleuronectes platessa TaxID=8262 RepID=A0A9N7UDG9_PLEPL|nr:unnamed protein product [Pleuronectes platessa]